MSPGGVHVLGKVIAVCKMHLCMPNTCISCQFVSSPGWQQCFGTSNGCCGAGGFITVLLRAHRALCFLLVLLPSSLEEVCCQGIGVCTSLWGGKLLYCSTADALFCFVLSTCLVPGECVVMVITHMNDQNIEDRTLEVLIDD